MVLVALALDAVSPVEAPLRTTTSLTRLVAFLVVDCLAVLRAPRREQLGREREEAERAREQLQEFVGMVSHDLRNPVSAMHLATRGLWLWRGAGPDEESLTAREGAIGRMRRLVNELLNATRIGAGSFFGVGNKTVSEVARWTDDPCAAEGYIGVAR